MTHASPPLRVMVVDDEPLLTRLVNRLLSQEEGLELAGAASGPAEAAILAGTLQPDVALLDVRMGGGGGPEAARLLASISPRTKTIAYTSTVDVPSLLEMVRAGSVGYVSKMARPQELLAVIHKAGDLSRADGSNQAGTAVESRRCVRLLIAHPDADVARALAALLGAENSMHVVAATADPASALASACIEAPDVVLIDTAMPAGSAGGLAGEISRGSRQPTSPPTTSSATAPSSTRWSRPAPAAASSTSPPCRRCAAWWTKLSPTGTGRGQRKQGGTPSVPWSSAFPRPDTHPWALLPAAVTER